MRRRKCFCGSGFFRYLLKDARGIAVGYVCDKCEAEKKKGYRPEIFTDSNYSTSEPIEPDDESGMEWWRENGWTA